MNRRIALVGHCGHDGPRMQAVIGRMFDTGVDRINDPDALQTCCKSGPTLLLVNRELVGRWDNVEGVGLIRRVGREFPQAKAMLISDHADAQREAAEAGAVAGFGKTDLGTSKVEQVIRGALDD